jgi:diguanylate cyclase (GGDEF)-like protein
MSAVRGGSALGEAGEVVVAQRRHLGWSESLVPALGIGAVVFVACLFGIYSRPLGFLASIWPANAILLGLLVRKHEWASPLTWVLAALAYVGADLVTGSTPAMAISLNAANMIGVGVGYSLFMRLSEADRRLRRPLSVLFMFSIAVISATAAAIPGALAIRALFGTGLVAGGVPWFLTELVNYSIILPAFLTAPSRQLLVRRRAWRSQARRINPWPFVAVVLSVLGAVVIGGPGAIAFPVPALLWCALTYPLFATACLTMVVCLQAQMAVASGWIGGNLEGFVEGTLTSMRLGVTLLALGPLTVASVNSARNNLIRRLDYAVRHDPLTGCLTRPAFLAAAVRLMEESARTGENVFALMLDVDYFKSINDKFGHATGDKVLVAVSEAIRSVLRAEDALGRLGGEEFAIIMTCRSADEAQGVSERILNAVRSLRIDPDAALHVTISIGLAGSAGSRLAFEALLAQADKQVYRAKSEGRDRLCAA